MKQFKNIGKINNKLILNFSNPSKSIWSVGRIRSNNRSQPASQPASCFFFSPQKANKKYIIVDIIIEIYSNEATLYTDILTLANA